MRGIVQAIDAVKLTVVAVCIYSVRASSSNCVLLLWQTVLAQVLLVDVGTKVLAQSCRAETRIVSKLLNLIHLVEMAWHFVGFFLLVSPRHQCSHAAEAGSLFALCTFSVSFLSAFLWQVWDWVTSN